jgi:hypothetical protein
MDKLTITTSLHGHEATVDLVPKTGPSKRATGEGLSHAEPALVDRADARRRQINVDGLNGRSVLV